MAAEAPGVSSSRPSTAGGKAAPPTQSAQRRAGRPGLIDRLARKAVQVGFLVLFLFPLAPMVYYRLAGKTVPPLSSWLLPFDPLLFLGHLVHRDWSVLVLGAPLLLMAATVFLGRFFCGWVCPLGTVLDLERGLVDGIARLFSGGKRRRPPRAGRVRAFPGNGNSPARYLVLAAVVAGGALSLQALGVLDPLVIFHRTATLITSDILALQRPLLRMYIAASAVCLAILVLEVWQPRFWCRHLCPLGALLNLSARGTLLNRRVNSACNSCGDCRRACPMQAIPKEGHDTQYGDCHLCLECEAVCPRHAISFGLGGLAGQKWHGEGKTIGPDGKPRLRGRYLPDPAGHNGLALSRRTFVAGVAAGAAGLVVPAALTATPQAPVIRPPGSLPEPEFLRTCILCQECVRVCPASALRPSTWQAGAAGIGTPHLAARQGGCQLLTSCPNLCAQVCPVGAIRPIPKEQMKIALAYVDRNACLAWDQGRKCLVCVEACPTGAAQAFNGRVTVDPQKCTGCGKCEQGCPVADGAIHVRPLAA